MSQKATLYGTTELCEQDTLNQQKKDKTQNTGELELEKSVLELTVMGYPGNRITPLRIPGIQLPRNQITPLRESGI